MALQRSEFGESFGHDPDPEMTLALASAGVTDVQVTLIDHLKVRGLQ